MSNLYLHVGPHKTGSSYLQKLWTDNRNKLASKGIVYPNEVFFSMNGHHRLANSLIAGKVNAEMRKHIKKLDKETADILISSEVFSMMKKKHMLLLKKFFPSKIIKIIYYFRTPSFRLISYWQETVKHGGTQSFFEYAFPHISSPLLSDQVNVIKHLDMLEDIFGHDNINLIDYDHAFEQGMTMRYFEEAIGRDYIIGDHDISVNSMRDLTEIEILRMINQMIEKEYGIKSRNIRKKFDVVKKRLNLADIIKSLEEFKINVELGDLLMDRMIRKRVHTKYGDRFIGELSKLQKKKYEIISDQWASNKKIIDEIFTLSKVIMSSK